MKKNFVILLMLIGLGATAQFNFGLRGGLNSNKYILNNDNTLVEDARFGFVGGMFFRVQSGFFSFQPEVLYSQKNGKYTYNTLEDGVDTLFKNNINFVDIPFTFCLHLGNAIRLNTGPVFNLLLGEDIRYTVANADALADVFDDVSNTINVAWSVGIGIEINQFVFDVHYEYSLNQVMHTFHIPGTDINLNPNARNSIWQFTIGYKFLDNS